MPLGIFTAAKHVGVLNDVLFYYELKCLTVSGGFPKGCVIEYIKARYTYSEAAIWKKLRRLITLGWMRRKNGNYNLCSYNTLFQCLGLKDIKIIKTDVSKLIFHPRHNLEPCSIKELLMTAEIEGNIRKQERKIKSLTRESHNKKQINFVATLSCEGVAKILGYKTSTQGWHIERGLVDKGLISVKNRKAYKGRSTFYHTIPVKCFVVNNSVIRQLPNEIKIV